MNLKNNSIEWKLNILQKGKKQYFLMRNCHKPRRNSTKLKDHLKKSNSENREETPMFSLSNLN